MIKKIIIGVLLVLAVVMTYYLIIEYNTPQDSVQQVRQRGMDRYVAIEETQFERLIQALEQIAYHQQPK
jgi:hypothetical protein